MLPRRGTSEKPFAYPRTRDLVDLASVDTRALGAMPSAAGFHIVEPPVDDTTCAVARRRIRRNCTLFAKSCGGSAARKKAGRGALRFPERFRGLESGRQDLNH
jgi:hypothetical protein